MNTGSLWGAQRSGPPNVACVMTAPFWQSPNMISVVALSGCNALHPASMSVTARRLHVFVIMKCPFLKSRMETQKNRASRVRRPVWGIQSGQPFGLRRKLAKCVGQFGLWAAAHVVALNILRAYPRQMGAVAEPGWRFADRGPAPVHASGQSHQNDSGQRDLFQCHSQSSLRQVHSPQSTQRAQRNPEWVYRIYRVLFCPFDDQSVACL